MKKRIFAFALMLVLLCSLSAPAFAAQLKKNLDSSTSQGQAQYKSSRDFIEAVNEVDGFSCTAGEVYTGSGGETYEIVNVSYAGGELSPYKSNLTMFFNEPGDEVQLVMYNLISFEAGELADVLTAINDVNAAGSGVKFYVDTSDNTVTAEMYQLTTPETCVEIAATALGFLISYTDAVYESLTDYAA